jgi:hypothetical protein
MAVTLIDPGELRGKLSSKKDWYCFLKYNKGYFLPSFKATKL